MSRWTSLAWFGRLGMVVLLTHLFTSLAPAAPLNYWWDLDGSGVSGLGGSGIWNTSAYWWQGDPPGSEYGVTWPTIEPSRGINAFFNYAPVSGPSTVTLTSPVTVNAITFGADRYTLTGSQINLGAGDGTGTIAKATIAVTNAGQTATIASALVSTNGLNKTGSGTLILANNSSAISGATNINAGVLAFSGGNPLATSAVTVGTDGKLQVPGSAPSGLMGQYYNMSGSNANIDAATYASLANVNGLIGTAGNVLSGSFPSNSTYNLSVFDFDYLARKSPGYPIIGNTDAFVAKWTGTFYAPVAGIYTFSTYADDRSRFWLDGVDTSLNASNGTATVTLAAGAHPIVVVAQEGAGDQSMYMNVQGPANTVVKFNQRVPNTLLSYGNTTSTIGSLAGGGTVELGTATLDVGSDNTSTTFSGTITGMGGLTKSGTGILALSGTSPFNGYTTIGAGAIRLDSPLALQYSSVTVAVANGLTFGVNSATVGGLNGSGNVDLSTTTSQPVTLSISGAGNYSGVLSGVGGASIIKTGFSTQTFSNVQTYSGSTTVNGGTLALGINSALPTGTNLIVDGPANITNGPSAILNMGAFTNTVAGVSLRGLGAIYGTGTLTLSAGNYDFRSGYVGAILAGASGVGATKTTSGYVTFNGAAPATYPGDTNITAGGIILAANNVLSNTSAINITTAGAVLDLAATTGQVSGAISLEGGARLLGTAANQLSLGSNNLNLKDGFLTGGISTANAVNKTTTGTVFLGGNSGYAGVTTVTSGSLVLGHANALGATSGNTVVSNGTFIDINGQSVAAEPVTINGAGSANSYGALTNLSGVYGVWSGPVTLGSNATIGAVTNWTISGAIGEATAGTATLTKDGPGILALTAAAAGTRTSATYINAGTVRLTNASALGTGTVNLNGGILNLAVDAGTTFSFPVVVQANSVIEVDRSTAYWTAGVADTVASLSIGDQKLTFRPGLFTNSAPTLNFTATTLAGSPTFEVDPLTYDSAAPVLSLGTINDGGTARTILKTGRGQLTIGSNATLVNSGAGTTVNVNGGTLYLNAATALGSQAVVNLDVAANTPATIGSSTAGYLVWHAVLAVNASTTLGALNGPGTVLVTTGQTLTLGGANNLDSNFYGVFTGTQTSYAGTTGGFTKAGSGIVTLGGFNYNTGTVTVSSGTLRVLDNAGVLGVAGTPIALAGGTLDIRANGSPTFSAAGTLTISGNAAINVGKNTLTTGAGFAGNGSNGYNVFSIGSPLAMSGQTLTVTGDTNYGLKITGIPTYAAGTNSTFSIADGVSLELSGAAAATTGSIIKSGGGLLILSGVSLNTGTVTVNSGTVRATQSNSFGLSTAPNAVTLNGGNLDLRNNGAAPSGQPFSRNVTVSADATITTGPWAGVSGYNTNAAVVPTPVAAVSHTMGALSIGNNQLTLNSTGGVGLNFGNTTLTGNATFNVGAGQQVVLGSLQASTYGFTKTGNGLMILSSGADSSFTGQINVNGGTLRLADGLVGQYYSMATNTDIGGAAYASLAAVNSLLGTSGNFMTGTVYENLLRTTFTFPNTWPGFPAVGPVDNFVVKWTGSFYAPVAGNYTFGPRQTTRTGSGLMATIRRGLPTTKAQP